MFDYIRGKKWLILFIVLFISDLFLESVFLMLRPMYKELNYFLFEKFGLSINYIMLIMLVFLVPLIYSLTFIIRYGISIKKENEVKPHLANKILGIFSLLVVVGFFVVLVITFGEDATVLAYVLEYYSPFIFLIIALGFLVFLFSLLDEMIIKAKKKVDPFLIPRLKKYIPLIFVTLFYSWLLIMPLIFQPVYVIDGALPDKPLIIAHRGGARYAPENTLAAAMYSNQIGTDGLEIDVQISYDGIPFLMHDDTLLRTTNVSESFPALVDTPASFFNISQLQSLNAGEWFVNEDPYGKLEKGEVPTDLIDDYREATIPTLEEIMTFSKNNDMIVNVDFKSPSEDHPYYDQFFSICLGIVIAANHDSKVWITAYNTDWLDNVTVLAPDIVTALSIGFTENPTPAEFFATGYDMLNSPHQKKNSVFREYYEANVTINTWTVNMASRFQQLWSLGVYSVTTDEPIIYIDIENPVLLMDKSTYVLIWVLSYTLGALVIVSIKLILIKKGKYS